MNALKYTDRDVRENENFGELAKEYLLAYEGEFDFLIDCKMRVTSGRDLTVAMVRGVLNCMRADPRLSYDLPDPLPPEEGVVVQFPTRSKAKKRKKQKRPEMFDCPLMEAGTFHRHKLYPANSPMRYCSGLYRINRQAVTTQVNVNMPYAKGKSYTTTLIHKVADDQHHAIWYPRSSHEYGFGHVQFNIKLACKLPSWLVNPVLLDQTTVDEYNYDPWKLKGQAIVWTMCPRCFPPW